DRLRGEARRRGIALFGDVPIYVAPDSVDVVSHRDLFALDANGHPLEVAGVPPDFFSATGQLWGYPLYRWDRMEEDGFAWWIDRLRAAFRLTDLVRLDHFRGFVEYWAVPAGEPTAANGRWQPGPGRALFDAVRSELGDVQLVAEDLGTITPDVRALLKDLGLPGMKVLQFAFYGEDTYLPHRHVPNAVVYTGTHDNDTSRGWWEGLTGEERGRVRDYLGSDGTEIEWDLIRAAYASVAERAIVPLQDVFGLGSEARMNTPGEGVGSWSWRAREEDFTPERAARLRRLAALTGR
ncbi:MAG: 4-alpha-glucanotransferase, partial [Acidobacteriota bacterium]